MTTTTPLPIRDGPSFHRLADGRRLGVQQHAGHLVVPRSERALSQLAPDR